MKSALCLSGIIGGTQGKNGRGELVDFGLCAKTMFRNIIDVNNCDVYIHSWSVDQQEELVEVYRPEISKFEAQIDFFEGGKILIGPVFNVRSRMYSVRESLKLKNKSGMKYDWTMIVRFDFMALKKFDFSQFKGKYLYVPYLAVNSPSRRWEPPQHINQSEKKDQLNDIYLIGSSSTIDSFIFNEPSDWIGKIGNVHKAFWSRANAVIGIKNVRYYGWRSKDWDLYRWGICHSLN